MVSATRVPINHTTWLRPMGPTDCLAPWIDRLPSTPLAAPARPVRRAYRSADLLGGERRCTKHPRGVVILACRHQLPGDTGNLVGKRHGREFWRFALPQRHQPRRWMATALLGLLDHPGPSRHHHAAQPPISGPAPLPHPVLSPPGITFPLPPAPA